MTGKFFESAGEPYLTAEAKRQPKPKQKLWSAEEDEALQTLIKKYGAKNWKTIVQFLPDRTEVQCIHRWQKVLNLEIIKGPWTPEEDSIVIKLVEEHGPHHWSMISSYLPGRIGKQCRERWFNILNPEVKKGEWKPEEDALIFQMYQNCGPKWTMIAGCLNGRTENSIKNRFYSTIRKMKSQGQDSAIEVKPEIFEQRPVESEEKMTTLISQIQQYQMLLDATKNQIMFLENSLESKLEKLDEIKLFQSCFQLPNDFNRQ